jgi:hypothetical protein
MATARKPNRAEIASFIKDEVRNAARTQLADSAKRLATVRDALGFGLALKIQDVVVNGVLIPASPADHKVLSDLQALATAPAPAKKKSAAKKKKQR